MDNKKTFPEIIDEIFATKGIAKKELKARVLAAHANKLADFVYLSVGLPREQHTYMVQRATEDAKKALDAQL